MAVLTGGIFSRPRGKTGGIVFGAARTRQGKLVTSRLLVPPSNPNTIAQQTQRTKFSECLSIVRRFGSSIYQSDFNRSVGQLPGFQSMESIYLNQMDDSSEITLINEVNLGILHNPLTMECSTNEGPDLILDWSTELGDNGTANDLAHFLVAFKGKTAREQTLGVTKSVSALRSAGTVTITIPSINAFVSVYAYFKGAGTAAGLLSVAKPYNFDTTA
jgi:hypothetical protein